MSDVVKNQSAISLSLSLQDIGDLLARTSESLELESQRRERNSQLHVDRSELSEQFVVEMELAGAMKAKGSSITKAFSKRKKTAPILLTNLGLTNAVPVLNKNYRVAVRVTADTRISAAKQMLYNLAKDSPWASSSSFPPLSDFVLRIKSLNFVLLNESLPLCVVCFLFFFFFFWGCQTNIFSLSVGEFLSFKLFTLLHLSPLQLKC